MSAAAQHQLEAAIGEGLAQFLVPLLEQQFARDQDEGDLVPFEAVADRAQRSEGLARARRMLEDAAPTAFLPLLERVHLVRARGPAIRATRLGRPAHRLFEIEADFIDQFGPAPGIGCGDNRIAGSVGQRTDRDARPFIVPHALEICALVCDTQCVALVAPAGEDIDGFEIAVTREARPGFVHRSLEREMVALGIGQDSDLVVKQAPRLAAGVGAHPSDLAIDHPGSDERGQHHGRLGEVVSFQQLPESRSDGPACLDLGALGVAFAKRFVITCRKDRRAD